MTRPDLPQPPPPGSTVGAQALDSDGTVLGIVAQVWTEDATGEPTWLSVTDGLHSTATSLAPAAGANALGAGRLQLAFPASRVLSAPRMTDPTHLTPAQERALLTHYWPDGPRPEAGAGSTGDGVMTRAEERLQVQVVSVPYARAVLRIETTTEQVMVPVTVTRQHARLEMLEMSAADPAAPAQPEQPGAQQAQAAAQFGSPWVTLFRDEPVVTTRPVPVERVRLDVHRVTTEQTVTETLGREEVVVEHLTATDERPPVPRPARTP